jgi:hypothetical protein
MSFISTAKARNPASDKNEVGTDVAATSLSSMMASV